MIYTRTNRFTLRTVVALTLAPVVMTAGRPGPAKAFDEHIHRHLVAAPIREEVEAEVIRKFTLSLGIGGAIPEKDLGGIYDTGTQMELLVGYQVAPPLRLEAGFDYVTGFLPVEGLIGIDFGTGTIIELRGTYLSTPVGLEATRSFRNGKIDVSAGGGVLYNRYSQSVNLTDYFGLAATSSDSRDGFGYYAAAAYEQFLGERFGIGAKVRRVWTRTSGKNVGGLLTPGEDYDPDLTGSTDDAWLSIYGAVLYRF
jgi:hypothetical protein